MKTEENKNASQFKEAKPDALKEAIKALNCCRTEIRDYKHKDGWEKEPIYFIISEAIKDCENAIQEVKEPEPTAEKPDFEKMAYEKIPHKAYPEAWAGYGNGLQDCWEKFVVPLLKSDVTLPEKAEQTFEKWLIRNYEWNGCGWTERHAGASIVRTTEYLYDTYTKEVLTRKE